MLWRNADFSCHAARRGAPTTVHRRVRCAVAMSNCLWPTVVLAGRTKLRVSKNFFRRISFCISWISLQLYSPKIKTKNLKNYSLVLTIVNYRNWLDNSPPLSRFWMRLLFTPNFWGGFRVLKPKSRNLLPRNLVKIHNSLISNCFQNFM